MYFAFTQRDSVKSVAAFDVFRRVVCVTSAHAHVDGVSKALEADPLALHWRRIPLCEGADYRRMSVRLAFCVFKTCLLYGDTCSGHFL